jgi:hypothetical protein
VFNNGGGGIVGGSNPATLIDVRQNGSNIALTFSYSGPPGDAQIDVYSSESNNGPPEGQQLVSTSTFTVPASGTGTFTVQVPGTLGNNFITALVTPFSTDGTSTFSPYFQPPSTGTGGGGTGITASTGVTGAVVFQTPALLVGLTAQQRKNRLRQSYAAWDAKLTAADSSLTFSTPITDVTIPPEPFGIFNLTVSPNPLPPIAPFGIAQLTVTGDITLPGAPGVYTAMPKVAVGSTSLLFPFLVFVPTADITAFDQSFLEPHFAADLGAVTARGSMHRHKIPALIGTFTPEPASAHNNLAPGVADPNHVVKVQVALVEVKNHPKAIVESQSSQHPAADTGASARVRGPVCTDYLGGSRLAPERVKNGECMGLHWLNATIEPGTDRWYYGFSLAHPLPAGTWTAYVRAITRAGIGDPSIRDQYKASPYRHVFVCLPGKC